MNQCFMLAVDSTLSGPDVKVRIYGHGVLYGELTMPREAVGCLRALFYLPDGAVQQRVREGEWAGIGGSPEETRWAQRCVEPMWLTVEPQRVCPLAPAGEEVPRGQ